MRRNPIRLTVRRFVSAGELRKVKRAKTRKKPERSNFVRYFESLENRGPLLMHSFYEKWTVQVREEMQAAGTWPTGEQETCPKIVAEYISRLLMAFWREFPEFKWYARNIRHSHESWDKFLRLSRTLKRIYNKIRVKGTADRTFELEPWDFEHTHTCTYLRPGHWSWANKWETIIIRPYTPYNDHGGGI
jgi:hypothetical protein